MRHSARTPSVTLIPSACLVFYRMVYGVMFQMCTWALPLFITLSILQPGQSPAMMLAHSCGRRPQHDVESGKVHL